MAREDDYDAIMARDPDALVRQIVLDYLTGRVFPRVMRRSAGNSLPCGKRSRLDHVIVDQGILPNLSDLEGAGLLPALFEVSDGVVGRVSRILQVALEAALRRDAQCLERRTSPGP